ncbi:uncharacterized protein LOC133644191 isoform X2 [Entelurus aequoreus]|uniref:uncharacterized protein LOC133644191 isoform X2 n=1 Tax=Entelurus aequoreus TaxID=161455 RepID=UPI002B1D5999|nr:uncharacterized protein LOC133644191 isoform X2 [Entelurus aequoreus]
MAFKSYPSFKTSQASTMPYDRILSIQKLNEVPNPWKGFTVNRCLAVTLAVLLVSAGVYQLRNAVDFLVEETGLRTFYGSLQDGSIISPCGTHSGHGGELKNLER